MKDQKKEKPPAFIAAEAYHLYATEYDVYKVSIKRLIDLYVSYETKTPKTVLDLACGTGVSLQEVEARFPTSRIIATDSSQEMLEIAQSEHDRTQFLLAESENLAAEGLSGINVAFCNAAFWYFDSDAVLESLYKILAPSGYFLFNISEPAITFNDGGYDDRFLQTMVEVLDDRGLVFHREGGHNAGRLKLSHEPPTAQSIEGSLVRHSFKPTISRTWKFTKSVDELKDFYSIPGFGTKMYRELTDLKQKQEILDEIVRRLREQGVEEINFRWQEFVAQRA